MTEIKGLKIQFSSPKREKGKEKREKRKEVSLLSGKNDQKLIVKKSNKLIDAQYRLPLVQQRILLLLIAQIEPKKKISPDEWYYIDAELYSSVFDIDKNGSYKQMAKAAEDLAEQWAVLLDDNDHPIEVRWVTAKKYFSRQGRMGFKFNKDMLPYISDLHGRFSHYELSYISQMKSLYGIPMYELLIRWRSKTTLYFPLEFLREKFALGDRYPNWRDFKRNVLEVAVKDLNTDKGEFDVDWQPVSRGNKVIGVNVFYTQKKHAVEAAKNKAAHSKLSPRKQTKSSSHDANADHVPEWREYGYNIEHEWTDAKRLSKEIEFDITNYDEYLMAKKKEQREKTKKPGGQKTLF